MQFDLELGRNSSKGPTLWSGRLTSTGVVMIVIQAILNVTYWGRRKKETKPEKKKIGRNSI